MTFEEFQKFIDEQDIILRNSYVSSETERERILSRTVKITEELGELCDEVLASIGGQRKGKMNDKKGGELEGEFADVMITLFLLAKCMNVSIVDTLGPKIEKIRTKHNKQLES